jgi:ABC-type tungstate transport system substrate-binding protein
MGSPEAGLILSKSGSGIKSGIHSRLLNRVMIPTRIRFERRKGDFHRKSALLLVLLYLEIIKSEDQYK